LWTPGEGTENEDGEVDGPVALISDAPPPGITLIILAGTCHFAAYPTQQKDIRVWFMCIEKTKRVSRRTMTFPNDPVPSTSKISYRFFFEKLGG